MSSGNNLVDAHENDHAWHKETQDIKPECSFCFDEKVIANWRVYMEALRYRKENPRYIHDEWLKSVPWQEWLQMCRELRENHSRPAYKRRMLHDCPSCL